MTNAERYAQQAATLERLITDGTVKADSRDSHGNSTAGLLKALKKAAAK